MADSKTLTKKELKSDQEVRWCPGCGDYAILNCVQGVLADLGIPKEDFVVVSGIGCSSRFPYYMDTYGFHSIHGRAPAIATGVKVANPDLSVWLVTGDGDGLSIGGNHTIHALRRNVDLKVLLFNNEIYGLTKGQYSPTSPVGQRTKSTPFGSVDRPFNPISLALGAGATFVARTIDTHMKHMAATLKAAAAHKGAAFVEIYQNCVIFNDKCFDDFADKSVRDDRTIDLQAGQPMTYGKELDKGIRVEGFEAKRVGADDASVWDPTTASPGPGFQAAHLSDDPDMPNPIGIFRNVQAPVFDEAMNAQVEAAVEKKGQGTFRDLVYSGDTWEV
ncbi:MAG: 2-oxoacid:ferredoxin oxidoreductase subunit beta [Planctomycetota bacterium]